MSLVEHYQDYHWIKVKAHKVDPKASCEDILKSLDAHHVEETTFLIDEVRKLAKAYDDLAKGYDDIEDVLADEVKRNRLPTRKPE